MKKTFFILLALMPSILYAANVDVISEFDEKNIPIHNENIRRLNTDLMNTEDKIDSQGIKGWISFNGTGTIAINDSYNVTSITDEGTGKYTITWDTDFTNTNYTCTGSSNDLHVRFGNYAIGSVRVYCADNTHSAADTSIINVIATGDQ